MRSRVFVKFVVGESFAFMLKGMLAYNPAFPIDCWERRFFDVWVPYGGTP